MQNSTTTKPGDVTELQLDCNFFSPFPRTVLSQLLCASRGTAGRGPPRERRVPPAGAVAEVIRDQSRRRRPPYPVPSNGPPSAPATDTAPWSIRKKAPRTTDAVRLSGIGPPPPKKGVPHAESPAVWREG
ncbi:unnamed protein product [Pleuronectes platessa]|uniref:Uncharacterized protein n=1 Tax=Pleuronectes platessa TaxID=8262 RepID=A0A9N7VGB1_PLEPL|nr:unnamed protein product [Pleuronectes platessa]